MAKAALDNQIFNNCLKFRLAFIIFLVVEQRKKEKQSFSVGPSVVDETYLELEQERNVVKIIEKQ